MAGRGHSGHTWRKLWHAIIHGPEFLVCALCYQPINRAIRGRHPMAPSVDMIVPWSKGGDPADPENLRPSHFGCNSRRGAGKTDKAPARRWTTTDQP